MMHQRQAVTSPVLCNHPCLPDNSRSIRCCDSLVLLLASLQGPSEDMVLEAAGNDLGDCQEEVVEAKAFEDYAG
jgi:hypothetical protein